VHKATASRALNDRTRGEVNHDTVRRVLAAARSLGYTPNALARGLRTARTSTVGVLLPDLTNPLFPPIVRGIEDVLSAHGYTALLANTDNDAVKERNAFTTLRSRQVDGFIVATARREDPSLVEAAEAGIPLVLVNRMTEGHELPAVAGDDAAGIGLAVRHLVELGHRRIAHLAGPQDTSTGVVRRSSFESALRGLGVPVAVRRVVLASAYSEAAGAEAMRTLLKQDRAVTAVVAANDLIALGALAVFAERGLQCPQDVSLVGYNDMPFLDKLCPPLTSVRIPHYEIGAEAARLLLEQLEGEPRQPRTVLLSPTLVVRQSTGAAPTRAREVSA
jgi:LacI family transcriptional regulator